MTNYIRLEKAPQLVMQWPLCGACDIELDHDGDSFICESCGTSWASNASDGDRGELYASWSGQEPTGEALTEDEASSVALYRQRLEQHRKWGEKYPSLYPMPRRRPAALDKVEATR